MEEANSKCHFSEREKLFLVSLVTENSAIIENKKTDCVTLREKANKWEEIAQIYKSQGFSGRTPKQLKKCWENIKQKKRKLNTVIRQNRLLTGGGPPLKEPDDPIMEFVTAAAPNVDLELNNNWDNTAIYEKENIPPKSVIDNADPDTINVESVEGKSQLIDEVTYNQKKRKRYSSNDEVTFKVIKIKESIDQQRELHKKRMETADTECRLAILKLLEAERQAEQNVLFQ